MTTNLERLPIRAKPRLDWRESINQQLQLRKSIEQTQFKDIYSFATAMFDCVDIYKTENIKLNLISEGLQQQLLGIQQTLLAGGSAAAAAKSILPKLTSAAAAAASDAKTLSSQQQADTNSAEIKNLELKAKHEMLEKKYKTLEDEHTALVFLYSALEKKHKALLIDCDNMRIKLLADMREQADRLNAENERIAGIKREEDRQQQEAAIAKMNSPILSRNQPAITTTTTTTTNTNATGAGLFNLFSNNSADPTIENFDVLEDQDSYFNMNAPSRVPKDLAFSFDGHDGDAFAVNWFCLNGPRSSYLATGAEDRKVKLWNIGHDSSTLVATLLGSNKSITSIDVESDFILASSNDYATRVWYMSNYKPKQTLTGHSAKVSAAKFLDVPTRVASGSVDRTVKIWDVNMGACLKTYFVGSSCFDLVYSNSQLITCHQDSKLRFWALNQINNHESIAEIVLQSRITSLDISKDGNYLLCSLRDNTIKILDIRKMEVLKTFSDEKFRIGLDYVRAKFSIDSQYISCGSNDGSVYIWNANSAKVEKILKGHDHTVLASCWSPDGRRMVTVERGRKVSIWA